MRSQSRLDLQLCIWEAWGAPKQKAAAGLWGHSWEWQREGVKAMRKGGVTLL